MKYSSLFVLAALSLGVPGLVRADAGFVTANVNLRAGPDIGYPLLDQIRAGTEVDVQGCTSGWEWCDVIVYDERGWVAGNFIQYDYDNRDVLLPQYGAQIGIPIISFSIGTYWDRYYRGRPFYSQRSHWYRYRAHHRPPPPVRHPYRGPRHASDGGHRDSHPHGYPGRHDPNNRRGHLGPITPGHGPHRIDGSGIGHGGNPRGPVPPGHLGPVSPGHPVHRVPTSRQRSLGAPARPVQPPRPAHASPVKGNAHGNPRGDTHRKAAEQHKPADRKDDHKHH